MLRLFILIVCLVTPLSLAGQAFGDMILLVNSFDENRYHVFLNAARSDGDSTKVVMLKGLYGKYLTGKQLYPQAEKVLLEGLDVIQKMERDLSPSLRFNKPSIYDIYDYLGEYYTQTGDYKNAEFFLKTSEQTRERVFAKGSPFRIRNLQTLSEFYLRTDQTDKAEAYLKKLIHELNHTRFNNEMLKNAYGSYYNGITDVMIRQGRLSESRFFLKKLVKFQAGPLSSYKGALRRQTGGSRTMLFRSEILLMEGKLDEALALVQHGIDQAPDSLDALPPLLRTKSIILFQKDEIPAALVSANQLLEVHLHNINKVFYTLNEQEKETMFNRVKDDFDLYNSLIIVAAGKGPLGEDNLQALLNFRLQTKALLLNYSRKIRTSIFSSNDSSLIKDYQAMTLLKNKVSQEVFRKSSIKKMEQLEEEIKSLEKNVSRKVSHLINQHEVRLSPKDLQRQMGADEAGVEMLRVRKLGVVSRIAESKKAMYGLTDTIQYLAVVIDKSAIKYAIVPDGNLLEGRYLTLFRNRIKLSDKDTTLYHAYWRPIAPLIEKKKTVYFSGDGVYNQININLLQSPEGYLEDKLDLVLLSNLKEFQKSEGKIRKGTAVFFGQPNFTMSVKPSEAGVTRELRSLQMEEMKESDFTDLPGTRTEVANGSKLLKDGGWTTTTYLGNDALESNLKSVKNPEVLHIATHGFFLEGGKINPMLRSGLVFSGVRNDENIRGEDGVLTAYEASALALDSTQLVVLSACETASGEVRTGEGIYGLQRAFLIAGASNIIMSLWKVDDSATQKLMSRFYENLQAGASIRRAFSIAQQSLRKEFPEPYYWGAFVLVGK